MPERKNCMVGNKGGGGGGDECMVGGKSREDKWSSNNEREMGL